MGAAVGAVGQRLLEQPGSHYLQPFCWRRTKLNPLLTGQMVHRCGLNDQGVAWKISEEEDYRVSQKSCQQSLGDHMSHSQMLGKFEYTLPAKF